MKRDFVNFVNMIDMTTILTFRDCQYLISEKNLFDNTEKI